MPIETPKAISRRGARKTSESTNTPWRIVCERCGPLSSEGSALNRRTTCDRCVDPFADQTRCAASGPRRRILVVDHVLQQALHPMDRDPLRASHPARPDEHLRRGRRLRQRGCTTAARSGAHPDEGRNAPVHRRSVDVGVYRHDARWRRDADRMCTDKAFPFRMVE